MRCRYCGGYVEWKGRLSNLTHTECDDCGAINCQEVEEEIMEEDDYVYDFGWDGERSEG